MRNRLPLGLALLVPLFFGGTPVWASPRSARPFTGQSLAPIFRHIGLTPIGAGTGLTLWRQFDRTVTTVVFPFDEIDGDKLNAAATRLHFMLNAGKWELANSEALLKTLQTKFPKTGWTGGWIFEGDLGSIVTNLREFDAFRKKLDALREVQSYLACQPGQTAAECLPKSVQPFFAGMVWDLSFKGKAEAACLVHADRCKGEAEAFFERLHDSHVQESPSWSLRVKLATLAELGEPLELLQALYARFINELHSVHFLLGVDAATAKQVLANEAPYRGVREWLTTVTRWQLERNADLASNIENPYQSEGDLYAPEASKLGADRLEVSFRRPFAMTRFTVAYDPAERPKRLKVYASNGNGLFYLRSYVVPPPRTTGRPDKIFTENLFFPGLRKLVVKNEGGRLKAASALGWPMR